MNLFAAFKVVTPECSYRGPVRTSPWIPAKNMREGRTSGRWKFYAGSCSELNPQRSKIFEARVS